MSFPLYYVGEKSVCRPYAPKVTLLKKCSLVEYKQSVLRNRMNIALVN